MGVKKCSARTAGESLSLVQRAGCPTVVESSTIRCVNRIHAEPENRSFGGVLCRGKKLGEFSVPSVSWRSPCCWRWRLRGHPVALEVQGWRQDPLRDEDRRHPGYEGRWHALPGEDHANHGHDLGCRRGRGRRDRDVESDHRSGPHGDDVAAGRVAPQIKYDSQAKEKGPARKCFPRFST